MNMLDKRIMLQQTLIIFFSVFLLVLQVNAEEIKPPSAKTGEIHGNQLILGVTDDANKDLMMMRTDTNGYLKTTLGTAIKSSSDSIAIDFVSNATVNISTNTTTIIDATIGAVHSVITNTAGTSSTIAFYNIAGTGCSGTPASGYQFTLQTNGTAAVSNMMVNHIFTNGICAVTAGSAAANVSVLYKDLP